MTVDFMNSQYEHLNDADDAQKLFGPYILAGVATVGDVRKASSGRPGNASIRVENGSSGFYFVDHPGKPFIRP